MTAPPDLDALERLRADATPGEWTVFDDTDFIACGCLRVAEVATNTRNDEGRHNRDLIVAAVNALPALIAELRAARQDAARLREACQTMIDWDHAEHHAPPYDSDNGAHWRMRLQLCRDAFDKARAAIAKEGPT